MSVELKIKQKHLALEPGIIRTEERKLIKQIKYHSADAKIATPLQWKLDSLIGHRKSDVRNEARATHLARAYIANKPYTHAELKRRECNEHVFTTKILPRVHAMVKRYGTGIQRRAEMVDIETWAKI